MTNLSDFSKYYRTSDADVVAADIEAGKIGYGPLGRLIGTANSAPDLHTDLVSYWELDEASGIRYDAHGANDLTDNNTVTQASGVIANAAQFTSANDEYLSVAGSHGLHGGPRDFSIAAWVYMDTLAVPMFMGVGLPGSTSASQNDWYLYRHTASSGAFRFGCANAGWNVVVASTFGGIAVDTWYFLYAQYEFAAQEMSISVNNGAFDTIGSVTDLNTTGYDFTMGAHLTGSAYHNGRNDLSGFWKRLLDSDERTRLWNGASGRAYADLLT
jgi:hypothetical protein